MLLSLAIFLPIACGAVLLALGRHAEGTAALEEALASALASVSRPPTRVVSGLTSAARAAFTLDARRRCCSKRRSPQALSPPALMSCWSARCPPQPLPCSPAPCAPIWA